MQRWDRDLGPRKKDEKTERQESRGTSLHGEWGGGGAAERWEEPDKGVTPKEGGWFRAGEEPDMELRAEVGGDFRLTVEQWLMQFRAWRRQEVCWWREHRSLVEQKLCIRESWGERLGSRCIIKLAGEDEANMNFWAKYL